MEEIVLLIAYIVGFILTIIFIILILKKLFSSSNNRYRYKRYRRHNYNTQDKVEKSIYFMSDGEIKIKRIMNKEENQIYYTMLKIFKDNYNLNVQVSFKAFLDGEYGTKSWLSFRDFYCDFLLTYKKEKIIINLLQ